MKKLIVLFFVLITALGFSQTEKISMIDYVEVLNNNKAEALFYYQNNWEQLRIKAVEKGYIDSYQLLETQPTKEAPYSFMLITTYKSKLQYHASEANFNMLIEASEGLKLMNDKKPRDFRKVILHNDAVKHLN
ncbi:hypothetical protein [uncultured Algibacter sp.]|uniref:hypothetical protein n=1 Tax=uncultured Algibacter sp. TaxID=298659 RepID=UPI0026046E82|nr:hypothetical protein [uncultured Algibacter sp.]